MKFYRFLEKSRMIQKELIKFANKNPEICDFEIEGEKEGDDPDPLKINNT